MAGEIPENLTIENVWVIDAAYSPDAAERRVPVRREHLERIGRLRKEGTVLIAGGLADMTAALLVVRAPDEASARALVEADVYTRAGVWTGFRLRQLSNVVEKPR